MRYYHLIRNSDAKILICSYANGAVDRNVEIICEDTNLIQKIVRVGPCQIKEEYSGIKLVEIINNVFKGVINRIKSHKERLTELDKEEREHIDDARERIRGGILTLENEIGALKGEERSLRNHKWLIENEIKEILNKKQIIATTNLKLLNVEREDLDNLDEKLREKIQDFDMVVD